MFNPIFKENVQGRKYPESCAFAGPEILSYRKPKHVVENVKSGHKIPTIITTIMMKIVKSRKQQKENIMTLNTRATHTQNSPIYCDGVQLTNAQCHMVPIFILWYRESWTIQLKYTFETKQEKITESYHPTHNHGRNKFWFVCFVERAYFNYFRMQL